MDEGTPYFYLTELAAKCTAKRLVPDYISEKKMKELKEGNCFRSWDAGAPSARGRMRMASTSSTAVSTRVLVTINLPDVALSSGGDMEKFWKIFDERLDLCYRALMCRHNRLKGTLSDAAPILWQYGALGAAEKRRDH